MVRGFRSVGCFLSACCILIGCGERGVVVLQYDPAGAFNGYTFFTSRDAKHILAVDMDGTVLWNFWVTDNVSIGSANGFRYLPDDRTLVYLFHTRPMMVNADLENPEDKTILFQGSVEDGHHSIIKIPAYGSKPHDSVMFLVGDPFDVDYPPWYPVTCAQGDMIKEIDLETGETLWTWRLRDYVDPIEHHNPERTLHAGNGCIDWSHGNTVKFYRGYDYNGQSYDVVLYNSAGLDTFWLIRYPEGDVLWSCGIHGDFGVVQDPDEAFFAPAHEVSMVENNVFMLYDNGSHRSTKQSRALKLSVNPATGQVSELWSWSEGPAFYDWWGGDADQLPNGNVLIAHCTFGQLIEVTPDGEIVWDMRYRSPLTIPYNIYQMQRVPYP